MSFFREETKKAIEWFNSQSSERQVHLVSQLFKDPSTFSKGESENMSGIAYDIREFLLTHNRDDVIINLVDLGVDETLARILVERLDKLKPAMEMDARTLKELSDEKFGRVVDTILCGFYGDYEAFDFKREAEKIEVEMGRLQSALRILRDLVIWDYLRGHINLESIEKKFADEFDYPPNKVKILIEKLQTNADILRANLMFWQLQDMGKKFDKLNGNMEEIVSSLKDLTDVMKKLTEKRASPFTI